MHRFFNKYVFVVMGLLFSLTMAQTTAGDSSEEKSKISKVASQKKYATPNYVPDSISKVNPTPASKYRFYLAIIFLGFGVVVLLFQLFVILKKSNLESESHFQSMLVTIIVIAAVFLITAGYDDKQIAPAIGLLGTIAGYLLGKR